MTTNAAKPPLAKAAATTSASPALDALRIETAELPERPFSSADGEFRVAIAQTVYDDIVAHGATKADIELCGVLVGKIYRDERGPHLAITDSIRARDAREQGENVTFTHSSWEHINAELDRKHPDKRIVGWYHTHPGFGIFLSEVDLFAHRNFFNAPWQVALVYDPQARREGLFFWERGEVVRARRYWIGDRVRWEPGERLATGTPPGTIHERSPASASRRDAAAETERASRGEEPRFSWLFPASLLCLLLSLAAYWFMQQRAWEVTEQRRLAAEQAKLEQAKAAAAAQLEAFRAGQNLALALRERLDRGARPAALLPAYAELLKLDPPHAEQYAALLPELTPPTPPSPSNSPPPAAVSPTATIPAPTASGTPPQ